MNAQPNPADFALALYETAKETHQRRDWRTACHELAKALKLELMRTSAIPAPANDPAPAPKATRAPTKRPATAGKPLAFTMEAESLTKALRLVCRAAGDKGARHQRLPIMESVLIEARGDVLILTCSDLDRELRVHVTAPDVGTWETTCNAKALRELIGKGSGPVKLEAGERLTISGAVSAQLSTLPAKDFPTFSISGLAASESLDVKPSDLVDALTFVQPSISQEETRYYLNGAFLDVRKPGLRICATDGSRLNLIGLPGQTKAKPDGKGGGFIIPLAAVSDLLVILKDAPEMGLHINSRLLQLCAGPVVYMAKLIDGSYPDFDRVIPDPKAGRGATFDAAEMGAALAKVAAISNERSRSVRMNFEAGKVVLLCRNMEGATSTETVETDFTGEPVEAAFNATFLMAALKGLGAERVHMRFGPTDPASLVSTDKGAAAGSRLCIVMPLRT